MTLAGVWYLPRDVEQQVWATKANLLGQFTVNS